MGEPSDCDLIERLAEGDREAFVTLLNRYEKRLYHRFLRTFQDRQEAADLTQQAFLVLLRNPRAYRPELGHLGVYLFGIARIPPGEPRRPAALRGRGVWRRRPARVAPASGEGADPPGGDREASAAAPPRASAERGGRAARRAGRRGPAHAREHGQEPPAARPNPAAQAAVTVHVEEGGVGVIEEIEHDRLWDYVNGELDAVERRRFLAHADRCGPCRRDLEEHEWIAEALHWGELEEPPATLRQRLLRDYHALYPPSRGAGLTSRLRAVPGWAVAAAMMLLIGAAILSVTGRGGGRPQRAPSAAGGLEVAVAPPGDGIAYQVYFSDGTVKSVQQAAVLEQR